MYSVSDVQNIFDVMINVSSPGMITKYRYIIMKNRTGTVIVDDP